MQYSVIAAFCFQFTLEASHQPVLDHIQRDVVEAIGDPINGSIHVYECCLPKQGKYSVGTARQYCGRLRKIANC